MKIANPLYDAVFKYRMSNDRTARKVLSTILDENIVAVELTQQEVVLEDTERKFTIWKKYPKDAFHRNRRRHHPTTNRTLRSGNRPPEGLTHSLEIPRNHPLHFLPFDLRFQPRFDVQVEERPLLEGVFLQF